MKIRKLLSYVTKVNYATSKTKSLKVGFPKEIGEVLDVGAGDSIRWVINLVDDRIVITVEVVDDE